MHGLMVTKGVYTIADDDSASHVGTQEKSRAVVVLKETHLDPNGYVLSWLMKGRR